MSAPLGANQSIRTLIYSSANGTGTALAVGSGTASFFSNQQTSYDFSLNGIMSTFTVSLNPATVTVGQTTGIAVSENAFDAAGEPLGTGYVTSKFSAPAFRLSITDATNTSGTGTISWIPYLGTPYYSGVGSGPITFTAQTANYPAAAAALKFGSATSFVLGFALESGGPADAGMGLCTIGEYAAAASTPNRTYVVPCAFHPGGTYTPGNPRFDENGTLWGVAPVGIRSDGTSAGPFGLRGTLLGFDRNGDVYLADPDVSALDIYAGATLVRQINTPAAPSGAAVDLSGNVYVGFQRVGIGPPTINEYGSAGNGNIPPLAANALGWSGPATDGAGNLYALGRSPLGVGVWPAGTFGASAPARTITPSATGQICCSPTLSAAGSFAVDHFGEVYATGSALIRVPGLAGYSAVPFYAAVSSGFVRFSPSTFNDGCPLPNEICAAPDPQGNAFAAPPR